jgi:hypothetical protein
MSTLKTINVQHPSSSTTNIVLNNTGGVAVPSLTVNSVPVLAGPAFSAYMSANQSLSATTFTKMQCNTEEFDTASCYDTSLYRFTPNVAGYYQVNGNIETVGAVGSLVSVYKNGSLSKRGANITVGAYTYGSIVSTLMYLNGSSDYIELYAYAAGSATLVGNSSQVCFFQAALVRGA